MLASHHILYAQLVDGNFATEYEWANLRLKDGGEREDGQAKVLWTLALAYRHVRRRPR